jgi:hypothetical protein
VNAAVVTTFGLAAGMATIAAFALALDGRPPPPAPVAPGPPPDCKNFKAATTPIPHDVVVRANQLLPQPNASVFIEYWDGGWWRFLREQHPPDAHIPFFHPGVTVFQCP